MTTADEYRVKAADLRAKAQQETNPAMCAQLDSLVLSYLRLAEQAERNSRADMVYETPSPRPEQAQANVQQQQIQPDKDGTSGN